MRPGKNANMTGLADTQAPRARRWLVVLKNDILFVLGSTLSVAPGAFQPASSQPFGVRDAWGCRPGAQGSRFWHIRGVIPLHSQPWQEVLVLEDSDLRGGIV